MSGPKSEGRNPYPGLRPFQPSEAEFFVGREAMLRRVDQQVRFNPITVMFARSGMGKSSFLTCRLLPHFETGGGVAYVNEWGSGPPEQIVERHLSALEDKTSEADELPLLVLDQFEDVFKLPGDLRGLWRFLSQTVHSEPPRARVLISMREEWLGAWWEIGEQVEGSTDAMLRLAPLTARELRDAILMPARREGTVAIDDALASQLLADLQATNLFGTGAFVEPGLVQLICNHLWTEAQARGVPMSVALYETMHGAAQITQAHLWRHLGAPQEQGGLFAPADRVLWVGLSRQLTLIRGVKNVVSPEDLARKLRYNDLGAAGRAVVSRKAGRKARAYLGLTPEQRELPPPPSLIKWIVQVLDQATTVNLVKKQSREGIGDSPDRYELCHDALTEMLQQFAGAFELMVQRRRRLWERVILGLFFVVGAVTVVTATGETTGAGDMAAGVGIGVVAILFYWGMFKLSDWTRENGRFFVIRRAIRGIVPMPPPRALTTTSGAPLIGTA
jgi:hypothetical protein